MATANVSAFLRRLKRGMVAETLADQSDRQLVEQFLNRHDEAVFEAIVRRHGAMVYRVCWRVLQHHQDAEDAFQATFLLLAQKLRNLRKHASLASWLHGVAHRVSLKAKAKAEAVTRRHHEQLARVAQEMPPDEVTWGELRAVLDAELAGLPEKWRLPLVLCYLEGRTQDEAAKQLGWSKRTLRRRLEEGRAALGGRLSRRGVVWPAALSAVLLSDCVTSAAVPSGLVNSTVEAASLLAAGQAAGGIISAKVATLTEGVSKTMFTSKLKNATAALVLVAALAVGAGGLLYQTQAAEPQPPPAKAEKPAAREGDKPQAAPKPIVVKEDAYLKRVAWSQDGEVVATIGTTFELIEKGDEKILVPSDTVKLWDPRTGKLKGSVPQEEKYTSVSALAFSPDKETVVIASGRSYEREIPEVEVRLLDAKTLKLSHKVSDVSFGVVFRWSAVAFSPDGKRIALAGRDEGGYCVKLWDVKNKKLIGGTKAGERLLDDPAKVPPERKIDVTCLAFSPDGKLFAGGDRDGKIRLFDGQTGEAKAVLDDQHSGSVEGIAFSPDGKTLLSGSQDKTAKVWDLPKGKLLRTLEGHKGAIMSAALSPDGKLLATGGNVAPEKKGDKFQVEVILWDTKTGERKRTISDVTEPALSVAFSPDGRALAVGGGMTYGLKEGGKATGAMTLIPLK
jgi:RNA polymerase sigma factor (sigma-70 family)